MHGVCVNYHVKAPARVDGNVFFAGPPPERRLRPVVPCAASPSRSTTCSRTGATTSVLLPADRLISIPTNAVLAATSSPIADAALYELLPAIGRWGSPIAAGASTPSVAPIEALRVNGGGSVARNEIRVRPTPRSRAGRRWTGDCGRWRWTSNADGRVEMFATDRIGRVFHRWQEEAGDDTSWSPWARLSGQIISSLAVARNPDGTLQLFGTDPAGRIFTRHQILGAIS